MRLALDHSTLGRELTMEYQRLDATKFIKILQDSHIGQDDNAKQVVNDLLSYVFGTVPESIDEDKLQEVIVAEPPYSLFGSMQEQFLSAVIDYPANVISTLQTVVIPQLMRKRNELSAQSTQVDQWQEFTSEKREASRKAVNSAAAGDEGLARKKTAVEREREREAAAIKRALVLNDLTYEVLTPFLRKSLHTSWQAESVKKIAEALKAIVFELSVAKRNNLPNSGNLKKSALQLAETAGEFQREYAAKVDGNSPTADVANAHAAFLSFFQVNSKIGESISQALGGVSALDTSSEVPGSQTGEDQKQWDDYVAQCGEVETIISAVRSTLHSEIKWPTDRKPDFIEDFNDCLMAIDLHVKAVKDGRVEVGDLSDMAARLKRAAVTFASGYAEASDDLDPLELPKKVVSEVLSTHSALGMSVHGWCETAKGRKPGGFRSTANVPYDRMKN
ncbi:hypothetical protein ACTVZO_44570 [Streptomyces sp. IBSNAI002]|uniref:hypothetical protein n=1 Tax=Streptomyces sp. IBSNAI002 TaxID=3457500 RepID=UPI003FD114C5